MEGSNKVEARKVMDTAKKLLSKNDYVGAKKLVNKAQNLCPDLDGLEQVLTMIDVFISASKKGKEEVSDWYGVLGVDRLADVATVKKQYKKLALLLHPDKNKFHGAEEAFKLVLEAWSLLSDKDKRYAYDQKMKSEQVTPKKSWKNQKEPYQEPKREKRKAKQDKKEKKSWKKQKPSPESHEEPYFWNRKEEEDQRSYDPESEYNTFWTVCKRCNTYCQFGTFNYLNKTLSCPNCGQEFVATDSADANQDGGKVKRGIEEIAAAFASGDPNLYR